MHSKKKVTITGATGFIGHAFAVAGTFDDLRIIGRKNPHLSFATFLNSPIDGCTEYHNFMKGADVLVHCAALVHNMKKDKMAKSDEYFEINVEGTLNLARQAAVSGVQRFIFISSIKVNGDTTTGRSPYSYSDMPNPNGPYAVSKFQAEEGLKRICLETGMEYVIIRPPLVYGPGVKANFSALLSVSKMNLPLPLGGIHNKRSLVSIDNLVSLMNLCVTSENARNQTFLVSDGSDISTSDLVKIMTQSHGNTPRLLNVPPKLIRFMGTILGKDAAIESLCGDLCVDINHTINTLSWAPRGSINDVLAEMVKYDAVKN
jgi:UDP-glucose 4-epimerase